MTKQSLDVQIRWMIRRDVPEVMDIEHAQFPFPWTEPELIDALKHRATIGMVATIGGGVGLTIAGYMIYELEKCNLNLLNFAVHGAFQRRGVGSAMVQKLKGKLSQQRRRAITMMVRESNIDAQLFFKACGFKAVDVLCGHYEESDEDAYKFEWRLGECE